MAKWLRGIRSHPSCWLAHRRDTWWVQPQHHDSKQKAHELHHCLVSETPQSPLGNKTRWRKSPGSEETAPSILLSRGRGVAARAGRYLTGALIASGSSSMRRGRPSISHPSSMFCPVWIKMISFVLKSVTQTFSARYLSYYIKKAVTRSHICINAVKVFFII